MRFSTTAIDGVWIHTSLRFPDNRGSFEEQFRSSTILAEIGRNFEVMQVNQSISRKGVLRGIHWTSGDRGQAKYVSCVQGSIWDVYVDLRKNSQTFGKWGAELLSLKNGKSVLISEGIGHAFLALEEGTVVNYLCTAEYEPSVDRTISPLDTGLAIPFLQVANENGISELILSDKDQAGGNFKAI
jgi:dTDP-4-dehydrorhamnose 3,5-epimerase